MDYVTPKSVIKIGDGGSVVLSYLKSCRRETISGAGTVVVGLEASIVDQAVLKAEKDQLRFQPGQRRPSRDTSGVAATVLRTRRSASLGRSRQLTLYGASPFVEAQGTRHADRTAPPTSPASVTRSRSAALSSRASCVDSLARMSHWFPAPLRRHVQIVGNRVPGGRAGQARRDADRRPAAADGIGVPGILENGPANLEDQAQQARPDA